MKTKILRNHLLSTTTVIAMAAGSTYPAPAMAWSVTPDYEHVLLISVDGMHAIDLANWVQDHPSSNFAKLANSGVIYSNAFTTAPSDSIPA